MAWDGLAGATVKCWLNLSRLAALDMGWPLVTIGGTGVYLNTAKGL
jgi:hypothetical protein